MKGPTMQDLGIVRAIDVGYRNCKYVEKVDGDRIVCKTFPSIAPVASDRDLGVDRSMRRNTMVVPVGNVRYEVGAEAALAQAADETHNLDDTYVLTDPYLALVRGALRQMRVPRVDLLIVGLPVSLFTQSLKVLDKRSDAVNKGMAAAVQAIAEAIGSEIGSRLSRF
jgi:PRTRC genetic system protein D